MAGDVAPVGNPDWIDAQKFKTPEALQAKVDEVFADWDAKGKPYTITGLALDLGFATRLSLIDYAAKGDFKQIVYRAKARVERWVEEQLNTRNATNGLTFNLQNNFGWVQRVETKNETKTEHTGKLELEFVNGKSDASG